MDPTKLPVYSHARNLPEGDLEAPIPPVPAAETSWNPFAPVNPGPMLTRPRALYAPISDPARTQAPVPAVLPLDHVTLKLSCINHGMWESSILGISRDPFTAASRLRSYITRDIGLEREIVNTQLPGAELWQLNEDMKHPQDKIRISSDARMILAGCDVYVIKEYPVNANLVDTGAYF